MTNFKKYILITMTASLVLTACGIIPQSTPIAFPTTSSSLSDTPEATIMPTTEEVSVNTSVPPTQASSESVYSNPTYGFSLSYPNFYNATIISNEHVEVGDKIVIEVTNTDPTMPLGDGSVFENSVDTQLSGRPAKLLTGYIGSVGGYIPQQFRKYVIEHNGFYISITLYALGLHVTEGDISQIAQTDPADVSLFESIVASMEIH